MTQEELESSLATLVSRQVLKGAVVAWGDASGLRQTLCAGWADCKEKYPLCPDTVFDMASVTKVVVTASLLVMAQQWGLLSLDRPFTEYLPQYSGRLFAPVSVRELASHISGFDHIMQHETGQGTQAGMLAMAPAYPPQERMLYSCGNYLLLSLLLEHRTGISLPKLARMQIFEPLGMAHSTLGVPWTEDPRLLMQSMGTEHPGMISDPPARRCYGAGLASGNAGFFSTAEDLARFCCCLLRGGTPLFGSEAFRELVTPCTPGAWEEQRAVGWICRNAFLPSGASERVLYHCGWSGQTVFLDLARGVFVLILTVRCGDLQRAKRWRYDTISEILNGLPPAPPLPGRR